MLIIRIINGITAPTFTDGASSSGSAWNCARVFKSFYLVSQDPSHRRQKVGAAEVEFIPYELFLRRLWSGELAGMP